MGAWIEILRTQTFISSLYVAPHVGAWIEIADIYGRGVIRDVAPHVGAWIEITPIGQSITENFCRTPRGCVD